MCFGTPVLNFKPRTLTSERSFPRERLERLESLELLERLERFERLEPIFGYPPIGGIFGNLASAGFM
jgi:hypothetical protein